MTGMRKISFGVYATLLLTFMRVLAYINEALYVKGVIVIVIAVIGGNAVEHAKDLVGIFSVKNDKKKETKLP